MGAPANPNLSTQAPVGAYLTTVHVGREVKVFAIVDSEVRTIAMFNTLSTVFFSLCFSSLSAALGVYANSMFSEKLTPEGVVLLKFGVPTLIIFAIVFFGIAIWARMSRGTTWDVIRKESKFKK